MPPRVARVTGFQFPASEFHGALRGQSSRARVARTTFCRRLCCQRFVFFANRPPSSVGRAPLTLWSWVRAPRWVFERLPGHLVLVLARQAAREASLGFEPRSLDSVGSAAPRSQMHRLPLVSRLSLATRCFRSMVPRKRAVVAQRGLEPRTILLSAARSNQLSSETSRQPSRSQPSAPHSLVPSVERGPKATTVPGRLELPAL